MNVNNLMQDKKDKTLIIIIAVLAVILIVLFVFFMMERSTNKEHVTAIENEKTLLQGELVELSHHYDTLKTSNDTLTLKLAEEQEKIALLMENMKTFRNNSYAEINRYKKEIGTLKTVLRSYVVQIDSLNQLNSKLTAEKKELTQQINWVRDRNTKLETESKNMKQALALASALKCENFVITPINKKGKSTTWKRCFQIKADFVISKNITATRGEKTIYMRIMRPDGKAIAYNDKAQFKYQNVRLTYTAKRTFDYEGERLEMAIFWPNDGSLIPGTYKADLFCENENIASTEFVVK
ncbi:MAG: hypothetical protein ACRDDZ_13820 [Marinifilaceae bacterium]